MQEIRAKTLLTKVKNPTNWFGVLYNMNIYRGCEHGCIYCDSRSECYRISDFADVAVKVNAIELLKKELPSKREKGVVGSGSMSDPYTPLEAKLRLTRQALEVIAVHRYPVNLVTKSDMCQRDVDILQEIAAVGATVVFTLTTTDDALAAKIEPGAPTPARRLAAMKELAAAGVRVGTAMMPVLPFLEDNSTNIREVVHQTADHGGSFLIPWLGMTLRDRQRDYYYSRLDRLFPGVKEQYIHRYGERYQCTVPQAERLNAILQEECSHANLITDMRVLGEELLYREKTAQQISLF